MPAPSLVDSCIKACIKNVRSLLDVGDFEYWKIRPVLQRIESPEQLHQIELRSPQIKGEDADLWRAFIARDVPNWQTKNYVPKNPTKWYEVYCKYKKEQRKEVQRDEEVLKASLAELHKKKATNVSKIVELKTLPKLPRDPKMVANGGVPIGRSKGFAKPGASSLVWSGGSKTKLTDGKSVLTRARREAKEISQRSKLAKPTHELSGRVDQIKKAPAGMVNEYRRAAEPPLRILSKKRNPIGKFDGATNGPSLEEREKRLRALTMSGGSASRGGPSGVVRATIVGSSDEEEDDDVETADDLFDEKPRPQRRPPTSSSSRQQPATSTSRIQPQNNSRPRQLPASSPSPSSSSRPKPKPSDVISSMISKRSIPARSVSPAPFSRSPSPGHNSRKPMIVKKRPPVDIFNRAASKKPRTK